MAADSSKSMPMNCKCGNEQRRFNSPLIVKIHSTLYTNANEAFYKFNSFFKMLGKRFELFIIPFTKYIIYLSPFF